MIKGNDCWSADKISGMRTVSISGRELSVFCGVPVSPYSMLTETAKSHGKNAAIIDNWNRSYTYCELLTKVNQFSSHLQSMGVNKGTHVGLLLYNCAEFAVAFLALSRLRAVTVPLPGKYQKPEVLSLIERGDVTALICDEHFGPWFNECPSLDIILCKNCAQNYGFPIFQFLQDKESVNTANHQNWIRP